MSFSIITTRFFGFFIEILFIFPIVKFFKRIIIRFKEKAMSRTHSFSGLYVQKAAGWCDHFPTDSSNPERIPTVNEEHINCLHSDMAERSVFGLIIRSGTAEI